MVRGASLLRWRPFYFDFTRKWKSFGVYQAEKENEVKKRRVIFA